MKYIIAIVALGAVIGLGYFLVAKAPAGGAVKHYENAEQGIAFSYPETFVMTEAEVGDAERGHYTITLVSAKDATPRKNSEGPVSVTVDVYQNNLDNQSLVAWVTGSGQSNFKLGNQEYATTSSAGLEAVTYRWSGLYNGETTAFETPTAIVAVAVTALAPTDDTVEAYRTVLSSFVLLR